MLNFSAAIVYRNLNKLKTRGIISENPKGQLSTYSKHHDTNAHIECIECHRPFCVPFYMNLYDLSRRAGFGSKNAILLGAAYARIVRITHQSPDPSGFPYPSPVYYLC